jgi:hypothetical protein
MKKLFVMALLAVGMTAQAEDYKYLNVAVGSTEKSISLETLQKITFENGNVVLHSTTGEKTTTAMSSVGSMYIAPTATSVELVHSDGTIAWDGTTLRVNQGSATVEVFNASGTRVMHQILNASNEASLSHLPQGVYIIRTGGQSLKVVKK